MSDFSYGLVVLTHGDSAPLESTVKSFREFVSPRPALNERWLLYDGANPVDRVDGWMKGFYAWGGRTGPGIGREAAPVFEDDWRWTCWSDPIGFCKATARAWEIGAAGDHDFVFYLEHDFIFTRPLDLRPLAAVLNANRMLAQMSLIRNAVNEKEIAAGGLLESRPGEYHERYYAETSDAMRAGHVHCWQEHRSYFTTNPSLMRSGFMRENPWPNDEQASSECEGKFGRDLVARGYSFGAWGDGQPWTEHIGKRSGHGY